MGIRIKDAELVKKVTGNERIPVSDGSATPRTVDVSQIKEFANQGMASEEYVDEQLKKIPTPDISGQIGEHNNDENAHPVLLNEIDNVAKSIPTKVSQLDNDKQFVTAEEVENRLEGLGGNDLIALEISEVGEVAVTYGEKSDFVDGQIRETGELVLEFNIE